MSAAFYSVCVLSSSALFFSLRGHISAPCNNKRTHGITLSRPTHSQQYLRNVFSSVIANAAVNGISFLFSRVHDGGSFPLCLLFRGRRRRRCPYRRRRSSVFLSLGDKHGSVAPKIRLLSRHAASTKIFLSTRYRVPLNLLLHYVANKTLSLTFTLANGYPCFIFLTR